MAIQLSRVGWLQMFNQRRSPDMFLSSLFTVKPGGIFSGSKVAIDIQRFGEDVALVVKHGTGPRLNDADVFETKEFGPPAYGEAVPFNVLDLLERMAGTDPLSAAYTEYAGQMLAYMVRAFSLINDKIIRAVELQASQILQTGQLDLLGKDGETLYELDFSPKATHFPDASVAWATVATATPLTDLDGLAEVIRADGQVEPNLLIMGKNALRNFLANETVQKQLDNRRINVGEVSPIMRGRGATFYGRVWVGTYEFELWAYNGTYKHPQTGAVTKYVGDNNVIMLSDDTRLDKVSARVPLPLGPDPRVAGLLPGRLSDVGMGIDVTPNVWCTPNGKQIMGELESRPLLLPVQIDGFGCLNTAP